MPGWRLRAVAYHWIEGMSVAPVSSPAMMDQEAADALTPVFCFQRLVCFWPLFGSAPHSDESQPSEGRADPWGIAFGEIAREFPVIS
jgi:hypothetical protein